MLATVLMLATVMALSRVAFVARRHAVDAEQRTTAQMLCQNILQEVLCGARPLQNVSPEPFEGDQWVYMIRVESVEGVEGVAGSTLSKVTVQVDRLEEETARLPTEDEMNGYRLVHWMRTGVQSAGNSEGGGP
jgi:Tfp pilus assembly protein PilV